jgi:hypothetical protein
VFSAIAQALETGLGLKREHQKAIIQTLWVLAVSGHIAWVCGLLVTFGMGSPFVRAEDLKKVTEDLARVSRSIEKGNIVSMQQEVRTQTRIYCQNTDEEIRTYALKRIDELRNELWEISQIRVPETQCLRGGDAG